MKQKKPLVLIIEDDQDLSEIFSEAFTAAGFQAETFRNGKSALERLRTATPEVVSLDMHLPDVPGLAILKYIRTEKRLALTNVLVTTPDGPLVEQARELADFVLLKPVTFRQLRDLTSRLSSNSLE